MLLHSDILVLPRLVSQTLVCMYGLHINQVMYRLYISRVINRLYIRTLWKSCTG